MKQKNILRSITMPFILLLSVVIFVSGLSYVGYRLIRHERNQNDLIIQLKGKIASLEKLVEQQQGKVASLKNDVELLKNPLSAKWTNEGFNYLAIGNSITCHGITDFWWNEAGMAATTKEKDFVHLVAAGVKNTGGKTNVHVYNFYIWEAQAHDRAESLMLLDKYLDKRINLITIQLGENVTDLSSFKKDYIELIHYVKNNAPKAKIIIIDDFWDKGEKSAIKEQVAYMEGVQFVSLKPIKEDVTYQCGLGTIVYDDHGTSHIVEHEGVAMHPGDKGMEYIANAILDILN